MDGSKRFTFVIAFLLLLGGAALNDEHGAENIYFSSYYCYFVKPRVFAVAAILSLASIALGILYFITISSGKSVNHPPEWSRWSQSEWDRHGTTPGVPDLPRSFVCA